MHRSSIDIALNDIISSVDSANDMTLGRAINRTPEYMYQVGAPETHRVRGAFTRYGWENFVRERLNRTPETIAGDDTIFIALRDDRAQRGVLAALRSVCDLPDVGS